MDKYTDKERLDALERLCESGYILLTDNDPKLSAIYYFLQDDTDSLSKPIYAGIGSLRDVLNNYLDAYHA